MLGQPLAAHRGRGRHARGQAMVEAALVLPFFLLTLFMFVQLAFWTWDKYLIGEAAKAGLGVGNDTMRTISEAYANDGLLVASYTDSFVTVASDPGTPGYGQRVQAAEAAVKARDALFANDASCGNIPPRRVLNDDAASRGWDYSCVRPDIDAASPLKDAITATWNYMNAAGLGPTSYQFTNLTIDACYLRGIDGAKTWCWTSVNGGDPSESLPVQLRDGTWADAPSYMEITVHATTSAFLNILAPSFDATEIVVANRYLPSCPAGLDDPHNTGTTCVGSF